MKAPSGLVGIFTVSFLVSQGTALFAQELPSAAEVRRGLRKAVEFYSTQASIQGGYHFRYTDDLSYGRSEHGEGMNQAEVQREGTPLVGLAYLEAYEATGDPFFLEAARETAYALVQGQHCSGGWDYRIEFDPEQRKHYAYRADGPCPDPEEAVQNRRHNVTNLDDNVTQGALRFLMRVDRELGFQDRSIHGAVTYALERLLAAQYPNGAWSQRFEGPPDPSQFPVRPASYPASWPRSWPGSEYQGHYTFNDNSIVDMIDTMLEAARIYKDPRYRLSAERGGRFILLAQMPEPQPGWAQQYDRNMHPAWARRFEPPSVTGGESQGIMKILMVLYRETGDPRYLEPLPRALDYYRRSALPEVDDPSEIRRRACPPGTRYCLARFYELKTNRPLYITNGTRVSVKGQPARILDGYELSYSDESVITHYGVLVNGDELDQIEQEYQALLETPPERLRRPDRLKGLSPWSGRSIFPGAPEGAPPGSDSLQELGSRVRAILAELDPQGAWVEEGTIGKPDRVLSLFAAREMVLTLGEKRLTLQENDTLEVFQGKEPPRQRILVSRTFAENVAVLCAYLKALEPSEPQMENRAADAKESRR